MGSFDWKFFCELRPGLVGWAVVNLACIAKQAESPAGVTAPLVLVSLFQFYYVFDAMWNEVRCAVVARSLLLLRERACARECGQL